MANTDRALVTRLLRSQLARDHDLLRRVYLYANTQPQFPRDLKAAIAAALDAGGDALAFVRDGDGGSERGAA